MDKILLKIAVVSDVVCPWCYIGKRRLEQAMLLASDKFDFEVEYFPFELNPHMTAEGTDLRNYLCQKFGSETKYRELMDHVEKTAAREGLQFNLEAQRRYPNTRDIHRIILFAREQDRQLEVVEGFFRGYFIEGADLTQHETLLEIAENAGLDAGKIELLLQSNTGKLEIEMAEKELQDLGITSVPLFIVENRFAISGAQSVEAFEKAFEEACERVMVSDR